MDVSVNVEGERATIHKSGCRGRLSASVRLGRAQRGLCVRAGVRVCPSVCLPVYPLAVGRPMIGREFERV